MNNSIIYALIMTIAGLGIPIMAALNGGLGLKLQSPVLAVAILFGVGLILALATLSVTEGFPKGLEFTKVAPWYFYCGGIFVIFYILSITSIAPHFGVSNAVSFVLLGQLIAMAIIDHFGFMGAMQFSITIKRFLGLIFMVLGVFMVVNR